MIKIKSETYNIALHTNYVTTSTFANVTGLEFTSHFEDTVDIEAILNCNLDGDEEGVFARFAINGTPIGYGPPAYVRMGAATGGFSDNYQITLSMKGVSLKQFDVVSVQASYFSSGSYIIGNPTNFVSTLQIRRFILA